MLGCALAKNHASVFCEQEKKLISDVFGYPYMLILLLGNSQGTFCRQCT